MVGILNNLVGGNRILAVPRLDFAFKPTHMRQGRAGMPANGNQLRSYCNPNLVRSHGADVESDGGVHAIEEMRGQSLGLQGFENLDDLTLRSDHANVASPRLDRPAQQAHVVPMSPR